MNFKFLKFNVAAFGLSALFLFGSCTKEQQVEPASETTTVSKKASTVAVPERKGWTLFWSDGFDGDSLDMAKWKIGYPWGSKTHNHKGFAKAENAVLEDGILHLYAGGGMQGQKYNTGTISARQKLDFSDPNVEWVVQARLKLATRNGIWPAFWLNSVGKWPNINEIDIMEQKGWGPQKKYESNMHFGVEKGKRPSQHITVTGKNNLDNNWHTYAVAIKKNEVKILFDGRIVNRVTGNRKKKLRTKTFNVILNSAVGGAWGGDGFKGWIDDFSKLSDYQIDYVAIYKR